MVIISTASVAYLTSYKPFENPLLQNLEVFNEVNTIVLIDILTACTHAN